MDLPELILRRRMVRSFDGSAPPRDLLARWTETALSAPTAGNSAGVRLVVLDGDYVSKYFHAATDAQWREAAPRAPGLMRAGAVVLACSSPEIYTERYSEDDKVSSGLGDQGAWSIPYWHTDAAQVVMQLLLLIENDCWSACFWGNFRYGEAVRELAQLTPSWHLFGSVLIGRPDGNDQRSRSLNRTVPLRSDRVAWLPREVH